MSHHSPSNGTRADRTSRALRILYLEDNPADADLARRELARQAPHWQVTVAPTLADALARLADPVPACDLVLADLRLPDGSGFDLLAHVRERGLTLPVIMLTVSGDPDTARAALKAGADDYLAKRGDYVPRLVPAIDAVLARHVERTALRDGPLRVLYAEDSPVDADLVGRFLARNAPHIRLEVQISADAILARLPTSAAAALPCDVLLLDYRLPGMDALEIVRTLRVERRLDVPIVLVTAHGDEDLVAAALRLGVSDYLEKSGAYLDRLPAVIEQVYQQALLRREYAREHELGERLQAVLEASPAIVFAIRPEGDSYVATWVSDNITRVLGYAASECMVAGWWLPRVHPDDRERVLAHLPELVEHGSVDMEYRFQHRDGSYRWMRDQLRLVRPGDASGPPEIVGSWNDVTAARGVEERLRLHAVALESSREAVMITDLVPQILTVNPAFTRMTGFTEDEVRGRNPSVLRSGRHDAAFFAGMWTQIRATGFWEGEVWNRRKDGEIFPQWLSVHTVYNERAQPTHYVALASDLSELKHSEEKLRHLAHYDLLTGLPNRVLLELRLDHALQRAGRHGHGVAVLVIDLDRFKTINDSLGHAAGDQLLQAAAQRLRGRLRGEDTLARLAGDQFVAVMEGLTDFRDAETMARDLQGLLEAPFAMTGEREAFMSASIGIAVCPEDGTDAKGLLDKANSAVHRAKELGGNQLSYYTGELNSQALLALELEAALRRALERGEFVLHYQPKVDLANGRIAGAEALLRWQRPGHGLVPPLQFIPLAERSGLIVPLGAWIIDEVCRQMRAWQDAGVPDVPVALNVSARQFRSGDLEGTVRRALTRHGIAPKRLMLELTESMLMEHPEEAVERLESLKRLGVRLSLDDFGTGYSSLGYLSRFPIDQLKIDRSFVTDIVTDPGSALIATSVIVLAHRMGLEVVAEGVETESQLGYLRKNRCDKIQGYLFSRPLPAEDFFAQVRDDKSLPSVAEASTSRTLLVVDDEPNILSAIRRLLRGDGYRVLTAGSAREGLEILAREPVQVILSDQRMPEMNGTEFLARVKILHPQTVRIVLSGYTELESIMRAVNTGALYKFLTKPWDDHVLREHLRDAFSYYEAVLQPRLASENGAGPAADD